MLNKKDIFRNSTSGKIRNSLISVEKMVTIILGLCSVIMLIGVLANFNIVTTTVARNVAQILASGTGVIIITIAIVVIVLRIKWKITRRLWH